MNKQIRRIVIIALIALLSLSSLSARSWYGRPHAPRGEWFSLGFGAGTDALTIGTEAENLLSFSNLALDAEFSIFPQKATHNVVMRFTFGLLQEKDLFGRPIEGGTLDAVFMYRWQHQSGLALALGGGIYYPGFADDARMTGEAVIEPSFAFNLDPHNSALSMGAFRISVPVEIRYDQPAESWYLNVGVHAVIYII